MSLLRLLIADDHHLIRRGLRGLLAEQPGWRVVAEADSGESAVNVAQRLRPDIAILDFSMSGIDGPEAAARMAHLRLSTRVIILTMHDTPAALRRARTAGVHGFVLKSEADRELVRAIQAVHEGSLFFPPLEENAPQTSAQAAPTEVREAMTSRSGRTPLTYREQQVLRLLAEGMTSRQAANELHISSRTVETHRSSISRKLGLPSIAELVRFAIRSGIVEQA